MPIPKPQPNEARNEFISRCMGDPTMVDEFPENDQRAAVCSTAWQEKASTNSRSLDVEIFATGMWNGLDFTTEDLKVIAMAYHALESVHDVPLKFGHNDEQQMTDGQPSLGWISDVWVAGEKLMARFIDMPKIVYEAIKSKLYKHVSVELDMGVEHKGSHYSWVLSGVALLGADIPAVNTLADLTAYMKRSDLHFDKKMVFTAIDTEVKQNGSLDMPQENEKIEALEASLKAMKAEMSKLVTDNAAMQKENMQLRTDAKSFADAENHRKRVDAQTALMTRLDQMVKEHKITPASRDDYMREFEAAEDPKVVIFAVDKLEKVIESNPAYFGAEQARKQAERDKQDGELSPDQIVVNRANEYMAKHGEKSFAVAKSAILRADTELADKYTKRA